MNRRQFLTFFKGAPLLAAPSLAISTLAMSESNKAVEKINDIVVNTPDGAVIKDCTFNLGGNLQLNGDYQQIMSCHFETQAASTAISFGKVDKDAVLNAVKQNSKGAIIANNLVTHSADLKAYK